VATVPQSQRQRNSKNNCESECTASHLKSPLQDGQGGLRIRFVLSPDERGDAKRAVAMNCQPEVIELPIFISVENRERARKTASLDWRRKMRESSFARAGSPEAL